MHSPDTEALDLDGLDEPDKVAIVGLAGRYPEAPDLDTFWQNLLDGRDCLHEFTDDELDELGIPASVYGRDNFVRRGTRLPHFDEFDAELFAMSPREASMTDPQARVLLEVAYRALEHAGYNPFEVPGEVGVFAGCNPIDHATLLGRPDATDSLTAFDQMIGNDRDFLATRISHRLNLTGPALNVQSACSTSLVAVHLAAQHLLDHHCTMALAGGVSVNLRQGVGYFYQQGMILSEDGYCRAFDENANGTTLGQGAGVVVLKRLSDALADGDTVHAVIAGSAINNDGSNKVSYSAPSVAGQAEVIALAQAVAGVTGDDVTYVETHGTGTKLGDPVEIAALTKAFRETTDRNGFCYIGSVKTNTGHTDAAAGVTGLIKAALAVREAKIPASLHFEAPNEAIDFANSPFIVADRLVEWDSEGTDLRRAGVSSFGIGGTNAHVIVEEAPAISSTNRPLDRPYVLMTSASSSVGADETASEALEWAKRGVLGRSELEVLEVGRATLGHRRIQVVDPGASDVTHGTRAKAFEAANRSGSVWMFSGQGAQFPGMGGAHGRIDEFTNALDDVLTLLNDRERIDLRPLLLADRDDTEATIRLRETEITQPALFSVQYAMARQLQAWGQTPDVLLGHSVGEFAAAVLAGVLSLGDAVRVIAARGRLMQSMDPGVMVATRLSADELSTHLTDGVEVAVANASGASVAGGTAAAVEGFCNSLEKKGITFATLATSHAFHTQAMEEAARSFTDVLASVDLSAPSIPMLSNVTGGWLTDAQAVDPQFWGGQIRSAVRFDKCLDVIACDHATKLLVEVGPGRALGAFAMSHTSFGSAPTTVSVIGTDRDRRPGDVVALEALGSIWASGLEVDWELVHGPVTRTRVPAPTSVLDHKRLWLPEARHVLALPDESDTPQAVAVPTERDDIDRWCYARSWRRDTPTAGETGCVLVLATHDDRCAAIIEDLRARNHDVHVVTLGNSTDLEVDIVAAADDDGLASVVGELAEQGRSPRRVVHLWSIHEAAPPIDIDTTGSLLDRGVNTLLSLARALAATSQHHRVQIDVVCSGAHDVMGGETVVPTSAALGGPVKVIPLEYAGISCRLVDVAIGQDLTDNTLGCLGRTLTSAEDEHRLVAIRSGHRWVHDLDPLTLPQPLDQDLPVRDGGTYLIVGGLGGVGLSLGRHLAENHGARLALTSRSGRPSPDPENPETTRRLERLAAIEQSSPGVEVFAVDATDQVAMTQAISDVEQKLGPIDGVIVAAAVADDEGAIHRRSPAAAHSAIAAKVYGAVVLAGALRDVCGQRRLDFVLLSSSIASQLYHNRFGQVGYVTSNSFVEALAETDVFNADRVVTVAWDDWVDIGMSVRVAQDFADRYKSGIKLMDELHSFTPLDGVRLFGRALTADCATLFVSTTDLRKRVEADKTVISPFLEQALAQDDGVDNIDGEGSLEERVAAIWSTLLGVDEISPDDDFFDLGGDSLQVARMADRLRHHVGSEVPLDLIFDNTRLADLVAELLRLAADDLGGADETQHSVVGWQKLSPAQRRFLERGSPHPSRFNVCAWLAPLGRLEWSRIEEAVGVLVERHDALRTRIRPTDEPPGWAQFVDADAGGSTTVHAVENVASSELETLAAGWQDEFDITDGPVARFSLVETDDGDQRVFVGLHHLVSDRLSLLSLVDELDLLLATGDPNSLARPTLPFSVWPSVLDELATSEEADTDVLRWDALEVTEVNWPGDSRSPNTNLLASDTHMWLDEETSGALLKSGVGRVDELILLALGDALRSWTGSPTVGVDVIGHGRRLIPGIDLSRTVGFFLSYSPVWLDASPVSTPERVEALRSIIDRAWTFDVLRYQRPSEGTTRPRPRVLFNYVGRPIESSAPQAVEVVDEPLGDGNHPDNPRDHDIAVMAAVDGKRVGVTLVYPTARLSEPLVESLAGELRVAIDAVAGSVDTSS
ncbi:MAG: SDR family oxidoreductase [Actinomycetia bacterium]|nr:SDR family oxidoreductase [Actinomycetes bacterium]